MRSSATEHFHKDLALDRGARPDARVGALPYCTLQHHSYSAATITTCKVLTLSLHVSFF